MSIKKALRKLATKLTGSEFTGKSISDNIEYIADNYSGGSGDEGLMATLIIPTEAGAVIPQTTLDAIFVPAESPAGSQGLQPFESYPLFLRVKCERPLSHGKVDVVLSLSSNGFTYCYTVGTGDGYGWHYEFSYAKGQGVSFGDADNKTMADQFYSYLYDSTVAGYTKSS